MSAGRSPATAGSEGAAGVPGSEEPVLPQGCELPDGSKQNAGYTLLCGTCGERFAADLASELACRASGTAREPVSPG